MSDVTIKIGKSMLQHGKSSDRVYLMKLSKDDYPDIINKIDDLAKKYNYSKIFIKVPSWAKEAFENNGYKTEAVVPKLFEGKEDGCFMSYYLSKERETIKEPQKTQEIIDFAIKVQPLQEKLKLQNNFSFSILTPKDAEDMVLVYERVFATYPFPIFDPEYLRKTMNENIVYFGIRDSGTLVAISSCEMDVNSKNVEMTDFATLPEYRSKGLASFLLEQMDNEMKKRGVITAFTIARCLSYGMNITFAKHNYKFKGTLINNTDISGDIESMNVWYKTL